MAKNDVQTIDEAWRTQMETLVRVSMGFGLRGTLSDPCNQMETLVRVSVGFLYM